MISRRPVLRHSRGRAGGGSAGLDPRSLSNLVGWWNARPGNYVVSGSDIVSVTDLSGNGFTLAPSTSKPTLAAGALNGKDAFRFTAASSQYLFNDSVAAAFSGTALPLTMFMVFKLVSTASRTLFALAQTAGGVVNHRSNCNGTVFVDLRADGTNSWSSTGNATADTNSHVYTTQFTGSQGRAWRDSVARAGDPQTVTATLAMTLNKFTFGAYRRGAATEDNFMDGWLSEAILYSRALNIDEVLRVEQFLRLNNGF